MDHTLQGFKIDKTNVSRNIPQFLEFVTRKTFIEKVGY